jgi:hypothetical protein
MNPCQRKEAVATRRAALLSRFRLQSYVEDALSEILGLYL